MALLARNEVVQSVLDLYPEPSYLEVGVSQGLTFHALTAARKVAVDPIFHFKLDQARADNPNATYHQVPSDQYFGEIADRREQFDVIYLDGLHTLEQTLRDLLNALPLLKSNGMIVIDDIMPSSYTASLPNRDDAWAMGKALKLAKNPWMGDVYRLVYFIDTFLQAYTYRSVEENHGQLVLWRQARASVTERRVEEVGRIPYAEAVIGRETFRFTPLADILEEAARAVGVPPPVRKAAPAPAS